MADERSDALNQAEADDSAPVAADIRESRHIWPSTVWLVPLLAIVIAISMVLSAWVNRGPEVVISFTTAEGLTAGKTEVKYKNVVIGKVDDIRLNDDRSGVLVTVSLDSGAKYFATEGSRFWVVKPRVSLEGVSGLNTLVSGAYIGADTDGKGERQKQFTGLEVPPALTPDKKGRQFTLLMEDLGSLNIGSPVYYRRIQVGRVVAYQLAKDGQNVHARIFVDAPYDRFVTENTRFWNASGVNLKVDAAGLSVNTESLATMIAGGVAFLAPQADHTTPAKENTRFTLYADQDVAMSPEDEDPVVIHMQFDQSLRGLEVGAPVDFRGITLGRVEKVELGYDAKTHRFPASITATIYSSRLGGAHQRFAETTPDAAPGELLKLLVGYGLRGQLRTGNLLTGKLYVALDFFPKAEKAEVASQKRGLQIPTVAGEFDHFQEQLGDIVDRLQKIPFDRIGNNLADSLASLDHLLQQLQSDVSPEVASTLQQTRKTLASVEQLLSENAFADNAEDAMTQISRAARSLRDLADYLGRHPETLIRGKPAGDQP